QDGVFPAPELFPLRGRIPVKPLWLVPESTGLKAFQKRLGTHPIVLFKHCTALPIGSQAPLRKFPMGGDAFSNHPSDFLVSVPFGERIFVWHSTSSRAVECTILSGISCCTQDHRVRWSPAI